MSHLKKLHGKRAILDLLKFYNRESQAGRILMKRDLRLSIILAVLFLPAFPLSPASAQSTKPKRNPLPWSEIAYALRGMPNVPLDFWATARVSAGVQESPVAGVAR